MVCNVGWGEAKLCRSIKMIPQGPAVIHVYALNKLVIIIGLSLVVEARYHCPDSGNKLVISKYLLCRNRGIEPSSQMFFICRDQSRSFPFDTCIAGWTFDEFPILMWFVDCIIFHSKGETVSFYFSSKWFTSSILVVIESLMTLVWSSHDYSGNFDYKFSYTSCHVKYLSSFRYCKFLDTEY